MIPIEINTQPDDETCGPTSLHAVYQYWGDDISLETVIKEVKRVASGGTIASNLGYHALLRGYHAYIYAYNVELFDPSWFYPEKISREKLIEKLKLQLSQKPNPRIIETTIANIEFLEQGGEIHFPDLHPRLLKYYFKHKIPVLTGLSATYLYRSPREREAEKGVMIYDDIAGEPCGHFVVLCGYNAKHKRIIVADPHRENPISKDNYYQTSITRIINSILLGVLTHDANLLVIMPKEKRKLCKPFS